MIKIYKVKVNALEFKQLCSAINQYAKETCKLLIFWTLRIRSPKILTGLYQFMYKYSNL